MKKFQDRLRLSETGDRGFTLVEVLVAMVIFALLSTGVLYGVLSILQISRDSRASQVATNLASEEIDLVRAVDDLFDLDNNTRTVTLNGDVFTIKRTAEWVSDPDTNLACGSGGNSLRYKKVAVTVTWATMASASSAVKSYTVINPAERINDPTKGTIIVSVLGIAGAGVEGATITATPTVTAGVTNTAVAITTTPDPTDQNGCGYIIKVTPGSYDVSVSKSGYISDDQKTSPIKVAGVVKGKSAAVGFTLAPASNFVLNYGANYTAGAVKIPTSMDTSFVSSVGTYVLAGPTASTTRTVSMYPHPSGYEILAGKLVPVTYAADGTPNASSCLSPDASVWAAGTTSSVHYDQGLRPPVVATTPGATTTVTVPMGVFTISGDTTANNRYVKAVSVNTAPGCTDAVGMTYTFGSVLTSTTGTTVALALPYGTWKLYYGNSTTQTTVIGASRIVIKSGAPSRLDSNNVVLDPRVKTP